METEEKIEEVAAEETEETEEFELNKCAKCNDGEGYLMQVMSSDTTNGEYPWAVWCKACGKRTRSYITQKEAVEAWNSGKFKGDK